MGKLKASHVCQADQKRNFSCLVDATTPLTSDFDIERKRAYLDVRLFLNLNNVHEVFYIGEKVVEKVERNV